MSNKQQRRKRRKLSKLLKSAKVPKRRIPIAPPSKAFKSKKDYNRKESKNVDGYDD